MRCRFSKFVVDIGKFLQRSYDKIYIAFTVRKNLLQYEVYYVRL